MTHHLTDSDLEEFFASPEMEAAFKAWSEKYTAAAMVDLSPTALEAFPYQQSGRVNILRDNPDLCEYCGAEKYSPECCQTRHHTIQAEDDHEYCGCEPADEQARRVRG